MNRLVVFNLADGGIVFINPDHAVSIYHNSDTPPYAVVETIKSEHTLLTGDLFRVSRELLPSSGVVSGSAYTGEQTK